ncbi:MAG: hypothetical protein CME16_03435 [Gemmatimonadetes bacterium]|nr:hypothetical protein [Gemmatimonadota bacterium]|tara:strand:- start:28 stop:399 length:372 start_codon:yes stop_codon:yes gene_type:complete
MEGMDSLKTSKMFTPEDFRAVSRVQKGTGPSSEAGKKVEKIQSQQAEKTGGRDVNAMALELDKALKGIDSKYSASIDDSTGILVVRITDPKTGEIVKQVPSQELLDADLNMEKIIGLLVDDMA